ncbi:MAG: membrane protein insertion efficiency factor YidD [Crocinitomicaceae bacterium]|nr:membrane protein insertion efficiency factor YidD [Crocinitomicaceae bacterium]
MKRLFILPVLLYQRVLSPLLGSNCRFTPTCSQYAIDAIEEWGAMKGTWLGIKRISKCHPWGSYGYDPVPKKNHKNQIKTK